MLETGTPLYECPGSVLVLPIILRHAANSNLPDTTGSAVRVNGAHAASLAVASAFPANRAIRGAPAMLSQRNSAFVVGGRAHLHALHCHSLDWASTSAYRPLHMAENISASITICGHTLQLHPA